MCKLRKILLEGMKDNGTQVAFSHDCAKFVYGRTELYSIKLKNMVRRNLELNICKLINSGLKNVRSWD